MSKLAELIAERQALEEKIAEVKATESADALDEIKAKIANYGFTESQVFGKTKGKGGKTSTTAAKFRDPESGATWSGRGKAPRWIAGKDRTGFAI